MKKIIYFLMLVSLFSSCEEAELKDNGGKPVAADEEEGIYVGFATRAAGWSIDREYEECLAELGDTEGENEEKPYIIDHFKDGDILFISQLGTTQDPTIYNMKTDENAKPDYDKNTKKNNLYVYQYRTPENEADWTQGSNFVPYINTSNDSTPMNWKYIRNLGSVGNAFSFYALFQGNNQTPNCRTVTYMNYAGNDAAYPAHSAQELGERYGLFGAYHATSSLYTRMRFRMYPLFNLIRVTLLVPVQEAETDEPGYSGFASNAFMNNWYAGNSTPQIYPGVWFGLPNWAAKENGTSQNGIGTSFTINWRANRSSDNEAPLITPATGNTTTSFYLLRYDKNDPYAEHPPFRLNNVRKFYPSYTNKNHPDEDYDMVRRYEFIAYYVAQNKFNQSSFNALLSIRLLTPGSSGKLYFVEGSSYDVPMSVEGTYVPYYFYGNRKGQGQITGGDLEDLGFNTQGTYTHLTLYIPRNGNETVMVSARVMPWKETYTDMTIVERDEDDN